MSLDDLLDADLTSVIFNTGDFAKVASISRGATTIAIPAIVDSQVVRVRDKNSSMMISRNWVILLVQKSLYDFGSGIVSPSTVDTITVGSTNYEPRKVDGVGKCWEYTDGTSSIFKIFVEEV